MLVSYATLLDGVRREGDRQASPREINAPGVDADDKQRPFERPTAASPMPSSHRVVRKTRLAPHTAATAVPRRAGSPLRNCRRRSTQWRGRATFRVAC